MSESRKKPQPEDLAQKNLELEVQNLLLHCKNKDKQQIKITIDKLKEFKNENPLEFRSPLLTEDLQLMVYACKSGDIFLVSLLLNNSPIANSKVTFGLMYFYTCFSSRPEYQIISKLLVDHNVPIPCVEFNVIYHKNSGNSQSNTERIEIQEVPTQSNNNNAKNTHSDRMCSLVHMACHNGHTQVVKKIVPNLTEKQINFCNEENYTPLSSAVEIGNIEIVKTLLTHKDIDIDVQTKKELITPLFKAICTKQIEIAKLLIEAKANLNKANSYHQTPLMAACEQHQEEIARLIIQNIPGSQRKSYINRRSVDGWEAIHFACFGRSKNSSLVDFLIANHANVNCVDVTKHTPLMVAAKFKNKEIADVLIKHKADVNACDTDNRSVLMHACDVDSFEIVDLLVKANANIYYTNHLDVAAAHIAISNNNADIVKLFINEIEKIYIAEKHNFYMSPIPQPEFDLDEYNKFMVGLTDQKIKLVRLARLSYVLCSLEVKNLNITRLLLNGHEKESIMLTCVSASEAKWLQLLLEIQNIITLSNFGSTMLAAAIYAKRLDLVDFLLDKGMSFKLAIAYACVTDKIHSVLEHIVARGNLTLDDINDNDIIDISCIEDKSNLLRITKAIKTVSNVSSSERSKKTVKKTSNKQNHESTKTTRMFTDIKPIKPSNAVEVVKQDPKDTIRHLKALFCNNMNDADITWHDVNDKRYFTAHLPNNYVFVLNDKDEKNGAQHYQLDSEAMKNILAYLKKNLDKQYAIQLVIKSDVEIKSDAEIEIIMKLEQPFVISDKIKDRVRQLIIEKGQLLKVATSTIDQAVTQQISINEDKQEEIQTSSAEQKDEIEPTKAQHLENHALHLNEDEEITRNYIANLIFMIADVDTRLPLYIWQHKEKKDKWMIHAHANQVGIGSRAFFTSIVNAINQVFPKTSIAKQYDSQDYQINIVITLKKEQIPMIIEQLVSLQTQYKLEYAIQNEIQRQKQKESEQVTTAITEVEINNTANSKSVEPAASKNKKKKKKKKNIKTEVLHQDANQTPLISITDIKPFPDDLFLAKSHILFLEQAAKRVSDLKKLYIDKNNIPMEKELEIEHLQRHIYMRMLRLIKVLYHHHRALNIEYAQLEDVRLLFAHRIDYLLNVDLFNPAFLDETNINSFYTLLTDGYQALIEFYAAKKPINPINFSCNTICQMFFAQRINPAEKEYFAVPHHPQGAKGIMRDMIVRCDQLQYLVPDDSLHILQSDVALLDVVQSIIFELGFLARQMREQEAWYFTSRLNLVLSFSTYRESLFNNAAKLTKFESEIKTTKDQTHYKELLPQLIAIYNLDHNELISTLKQLNFAESLLLCIELRNMTAHKRVDRQRLQSGTSPEFYFLVTMHITQSLMPNLYRALKQLDDADDAKHAVKGPSRTQ